MIIKNLDPKFYGTNEVEHGVRTLYPDLSVEEGLSEIRSVCNSDPLNSVGGCRRWEDFTPYEKCLYMDKLFDFLNGI